MRRRERALAVITASLVGVTQGFVVPAWRWQLARQTTCDSWLSRTSPQADPSGRLGYRDVVLETKKSRDAESERLYGLEQADRHKAKTKGSSAKERKDGPRPPTFQRRVVILDGEKEWSTALKDTIIENGWVPERVQALPMPKPSDYPEIKWLAYLSQGIKLSSTTFVIAASSTASDCLLRFLEKGNKLRGCILLGPSATYERRSWDWDAIKNASFFFGLAYCEDGMGVSSLEVEPTQDQALVQDGLGLPRFPFGMKIVPPGEAVATIIKFLGDWQFLESLSYTPALVGEDKGFAPEPLETPPT